MKKKGLLSYLLSAACVITLGMGLSACSNDLKDTGSTESTQIERVYAEYVTYAKSQGDTPLTYEEWLASIQGVGIKSIQKTSTDGNIDTYTVSLTDGSTTTFTVTNGISGANGADGVGITGATVNADGELILNFSKGNPINLGKIVGANGEDGKDGQNGKDGVNGQDGKDGVSVTGAMINENGELVLSFSSGKTITVGNVVGSAGKDGQNGTDGVNGQDGKDGVGVETVAINANGELVITLTNDKEFNLGVVVGKDGTNGQDGVGVEKVVINENGEFVVTYTDGKTENLGKIPECKHEYSEWAEGAAATCTSIGYRTRECSLCYDIDYEFIEATGHSYGEWVEAVSTCESRWSVRICSTCGDSQSRQDEPRGHSYIDGVCAVCGALDENLTDTSYLNTYNGTYGYEFLGTMEKGEALQSLYRSIDKQVRFFHVNPQSNAGDDLVVANIAYADLGLTVDEAVSVWKTFKDDNPLYYWLSNTVTAAAESLTLLTEEEYALGKVRAAYNNRLYNKVEEYSARLTDGDTAYQIAFAYHDFIIEAIDYAYTDGGEPETAAWAHNVLGVFEENGAVCEGYARSFQLLLNYSGVENVFVTGDGNGEEHAWNLVRLDDGNWYWYDLTWDDPGDPSNGDAKYRKWGILYNYFCVNDTANVNSEHGVFDTQSRTFLQNHTVDVSTGSGVEFLYDLPQRSQAEYVSSGELLLNDTFTHENFDFALVGYNALEVRFIDGEGEMEIPERIESAGRNYEIISMGSPESPSTSVFLNKNEGRTSKIVGIAIPKTVKFIWDVALNSEYLEAISVAEENPYFASKDGVLFTKSLYTLICYPQGNARTEYSIPDETVRIVRYSFGNGQEIKLESLTLGKNVLIVGVANWGLGYLDSDPIGGFGGNIVAGWFSEAGSRGVEIQISEENPYFILKDGSIYNADFSKLFWINYSVSEVVLPKTLVGIDSISTGQDLLDIHPNLQSISVDSENSFYASFDGILYNKDETEIFGVPKKIQGKVTIPDGVTSIGECAFYYCSNLTEIVIPDSVTSIGDYAFLGCSSLKSVTLGSGLTNIGQSAFSGCSSLTSITIPDSVTSIGDYAFYDCSGLMSVTLGGGVTSIGDYAFCNCSSLTSITILDGVTNISNHAFRNCSSLTEIVIPDSVTSLGVCVFYNCSSLTSVTIGDGVTSIGDNAFSHCKNLTSVKVGEGVTSIGSSAFYGCYRLTEIYNGSDLTITAGSSENGFVGCYAIVVYTDMYTESKLTVDEDGYVIYTDGDDKMLVGYTGNSEKLVIPDGITEIKKYAFYDCSELTKIILSDSVTSIGDYAFYDCSGLMSVTLGGGVTSIGNYAFCNCYYLIEVYNGSDLTITTGSAENGFVGRYAIVVYTDMNTESKLTVDEDGYTIYADGDDKILVKYTGDDEKLVLPDDITGIGNYVFYFRSDLTEIVIPDGVTSIGECAFYYCTGLTEIVIPDGVTSIGSYAFRNCTGLTEIIIPDSVTSIGLYAFEDCTGLMEIIIPDDVTYVGLGAFSWCSSLTIYCEDVSQYEGWASTWNENAGSVYWYSETAPALNADGTAYDGNYWHYDENGEIVVWVYQKSEE